MQAARGTAIDQIDGGSPNAPSHVIAHPRRWLLFAGVAGVLYAIDQVTKELAVDRLTGRAGVPVVGDLLQLQLAFNPGAAFSLGTRYTVGLSVLAMVATAVVLWMSRRVGDRVWAIALGAVLAGIVGNLTDRIFRAPGPLRGHVVDFLQLPNWPIFNVADMCINVGAALVLIQAFRGIGLDGGRGEQEAGTADDENEDA